MSAATTTEWEPGEPLHEHPFATELRTGDPEVQTVRRLFDVIDDGFPLVLFALGGGACCHRCQVTWNPNVDPACWVCGGAAS